MMAMAPQQEMPPMDAGVASLPVPDDMYASADEGYAGGGIVAFQGGNLVRGVGTETYPTSLSQTQVDPATLRAYYLSRGIPLPFELMTEAERAKSDPTYTLGPAGKKFEELGRPAVPGAASSLGEMFSNIGSRIAGLGSRDTRIDPTTGKEVSFGEHMRLEDARRAAAAGKQAPTPTSTAAASRAGISPENRALYDENISGIKRIAEAAAPKAKKSSAPIVPAAAAPAATEANKPETAPKNAEKPEMSFAEFKGKYGLDVEDPAMADVRAKIASMAGESNLARQDARNMALLQAGLGMMAGTSPYALANIGAGGMKGAEAYAASLKDIKAAEKDLFKMQTELAKADQARRDGNIKSFMEHQEKAKKHELDVRKVVTDENLTAAQIAKLETDKQYLKGQLRKMGADERLIDAQINNLNKPDEVQRIINAYKKDPAAFKEAFAIYRPSSASGQNETKVRQDAEAYVNNPMLLTQDPKLRELVKKAKDTNSPNDLRALETYRDQLRTNYINRILSKQPGVAGSVDANNPLLKGN